MDYVEKNLDGFCSWKGKALSLSHSFHKHYCLHLKEQIFCIVISLLKNSLPGKYVTSLITCFLSFLLLFPGRMNFSYLLCFNWTCVEEQVISLEIYITKHFKKLLLCTCQFFYELSYKWLYYIFYFLLSTHVILNIKTTLLFIL